MIANVARHLGLDPEAALTAATAKFRRRYAHIEQALDRLPSLGDPARLEAMEALWREAKQSEREEPLAERSQSAES
jgi:ATP diphosphatase